ncbi:MAG TPA: PASTA domain-containing protein, partial [Candidatus Hydrogenedentes bacterium]|nr:PASTA domain-containing protein [Candidatus Hydrogenedentota bacterium]
MLDNSDWGSAGGLVGRSDGSTLERCYAAGRVFGSSAGAGGLVGLASGATDSFWDIDTSGQAASAAGTGLDTDQMKQQSSFAAWDFATVWDIVEGASYPFLRWQSGLGQSLVPDVAGMHFTDAITALNAAGFGYAVQPSYNESVPAEYVIEPVPQSGFFLTPGFFSPVTLIVSRGAVPHEIYSIYELQLIGKNPEFSLDDVYRIAGDIDASETAIWNGGAGFEPIIGFTGKIMGDGHTISDLTINRPGEDYTALFGMISTGAVIENLTLENLFVSGGDEVGGLVAFGAGATLTNCAAEGTVNGEYYTGGLAGSLYDCAVDSCAFLGQVQGQYVTGGLAGEIYNSVISNSHALTTLFSPEGYAGGLIGSVNGGSVDSSWAGGVVSGGLTDTGGLVGYAYSTTLSRNFASARVIGDSEVGGLAGYALQSTISSCYVVGPVSATDTVAGLIGACNSTDISAVYAAAPVSGTLNVGGLVAGDYGGNTAAAAFWDIDVSGLSSSALGAGLSSAAMKQQDSFAGFDFDAIWDIEENQSR